MINKGKAAAANCGFVFLNNHHHRAGYPFTTKSGGHDG
jgi:hypothetical protein